MMAELILMLVIFGRLSVVDGQNDITPVLNTSHRDASHQSLHEIVMVGHRSAVKITCNKLKQNVRLSAHLDKPALLEVHPQQIFCLLNETDRPPQHLELVGVLPGQTVLFLQANDADDNTSLPHFLPDTYIVTVVEQVDVARDAFMYVVSMVKFFTLLLLGFRMRSEAVKEVLTRPCALINAILCQTTLLPLVSSHTSMCSHQCYIVSDHSIASGKSSHVHALSSMLYCFSPLCCLWKVLKCLPHCCPFWHMGLQVNVHLYSNIGTRKFL